MPPFTHRFCPVTKEASSLAKYKAAIYKFAWPEIQKLATMLERTMDMSISVSGETAFISTKQGDCEVNWEVLQ